MKARINAQTGQRESVFGAILLSIADDENVQVNKNGTAYRPCSIRFKDTQGNIQETTAVMYEANYEHGITVGNSYLTTAIETEQGVFIQVSHLSYVDNRAEASMFNFEEATQEVTSETTSKKMEA